MKKIVIADEIYDFESITLAACCAEQAAYLKNYIFRALRLTRVIPEQGTISIPFFSSSSRNKFIPMLSDDI